LHSCDIAQKRLMGAQGRHRIDCSEWGTVAGKALDTTGAAAEVRE
jgi:hypothetical protein